MLESNIKELLKGKTVDELLDLIILGLEATNEGESVINTFKNEKPLMKNLLWRSLNNSLNRFREFFLFFVNLSLIIWSLWAI